MTANTGIFFIMPKILRRAFREIDVNRAIVWHVADCNQEMCIRDRYRSVPRCAGIKDAELQPYISLVAHLLQRIVCLLYTSRCV